MTNQAQLRGDRFYFFDKGDRYSGIPFDLCVPSNFTRIGSTRLQKFSQTCSVNSEIRMAGFDVLTSTFG